MEEIFTGKKAVKKLKPKKVIQVKRKSLENFFNEDETEEAIETTILQALEFYYEYKDEFSQKGGDEDVQDEIDTDVNEYNGGNAE